MIHALNKSDKWKMVRWSVNKMSQTGQIDKGRKSTRTNCKTAGYKYVGTK